MQRITRDKLDGWRSHLVNTFTRHQQPSENRNQAVLPIEGSGAANDGTNRKISQSVSFKETVQKFTIETKKSLDRLTTKEDVYVFVEPVKEGDLYQKSVGNALDDLRIAGTYLAGRIHGRGIRKSAKKCSKAIAAATDLDKLLVELQKLADMLRELCFYVHLKSYDLALGCIDLCIQEANSPGFPYTEPKRTLGFTDLASTQSEMEILFKEIGIPKDYAHTIQLIQSPLNLASTETLDNAI